MKSLFLILLYVANEMEGAVNGLRAELSCAKYKFPTGGANKSLPVGAIPGTGAAAEWTCETNDDAVGILFTMLLGIESAGNP